MPHQLISRMPKRTPAPRRRPPALDLTCRRMLQPKASAHPFLAKASHGHLLHLAQRCKGQTLNHKHASLFVNGVQRTLKLRPAPTNFLAASRFGWGGLMLELGLYSVGNVPSTCSAVLMNVRAKCGTNQRTAGPNLPPTRFGDAEHTQSIRWQARCMIL